MWKKKMVTTSRGEFEVFTQGDGDPLCVTHLYSEFNERGAYLADFFVDDFQVFLINLKEAGASSKVKSDDEMSMKESCKDLEAIREALGFEQWSFAGHSTGGMLALVYAINHPNSLVRVMAGGATASKYYMDHEDSIYCHKNPLNKRLRELLAIIKSSESTREERQRAGREWAEMSLYRPEKFDEYFAKPSSGKVVPQRLDYYSYVELPEFDIRDDLRHIRVPLAVYAGLHDAQCPFVFSEEIHECAPGSKLYTFKESNHSPFLEEKEKFSQMVKEFSRLSVHA